MRSASALGFVLSVVLCFFLLLLLYGDEGREIVLYFYALCSIKCTFVFSFYDVSVRSLFAAESSERLCPALAEDTLL